MSKNKNKVELNDIYQEIAYLRAKIDNVSNQMQELRDAVRKSFQQDEELPVRESYEHPWHQHIREGFIPGGDCIGDAKRKVYSESVATRLGFSGGTASTQGPTN
jgi:hypothetical protein